MLAQNLNSNGASPRKSIFFDVRNTDDLFLSAGTRQLLNTVSSAALDHGMVSVTGPLGSGKTTLSKLLISNLQNESRVRVIRPRLIEMQGMSEQIICEAILSDLTREQATTHHGVEQRAAAALQANGSNEGKSVLVIDNAQELPATLLPVLYRLWESHQHLSILLFGQSDLNLMLMDNRNGLASGLAKHCHLVSLPSLIGELEAYVTHVLTRAGYAEQAVLTPEALDALRKNLCYYDDRNETGGAYPANINRLLSHAMIAATRLGDSQFNHTHFQAC